MYSNEFKNALGRFKLENKGVKIEAAVALKSKVYCIKYENDSECCKIKVFIYQNDRYC